MQPLTLPLTGAFADRFVRENWDFPSRHTTQIAHYDDHAAVFDNLRRINSIILTSTAIYGSTSQWTISSRSCKRVR